MSDLEILDALKTHGVPGPWSPAGSWLHKIRHAPFLSFQVPLDTAPAALTSISNLETLISGSAASPVYSRGPVPSNSSLGLVVLNQQSLCCVLGLPSELPQMSSLPVYPGP